jgi:hypothetical protein
MAERVLEHFIDDAVARPDIRLVPDIEEAHDTQVSMDTVHIADVYVNVTVDVDGEPRQLCINLTKRTLGNDQSVHSFFERFEYIRTDQDGKQVGDFGRADLLASSALALAERQAGI